MSARGFGWCWSKRLKSMIALTALALSLVCAGATWGATTYDPATVGSYSSAGAAGCKSPDFVAPGSHMRGSGAVALVLQKFPNLTPIR